MTAAESLLATVRQIDAKLDLLLADRGVAPPSRLLSAGELAARLGSLRDWVYNHAGELGAVPLSEGARPRLGFDWSEVLRCLQERAAKRSASTVEPKRTKPRKRTPPSGVPLLEVRGQRGSRG